MAVPGSSYGASSNAELAQNAKVDLKAASSGGKEKSPGLNFWSPEAEDKLSWLSIEFDTPVTVMELLTQGSLGESKWTDTFVLGYSIEPSKPHRHFEFVRDEATGKIKVSAIFHFGFIKNDDSIIKVSKPTEVNILPTHFISATA